MNTIFKNQAPYNQKVTTAKELEAKCINIFDEAINHKGFIGGIQAAADYFGFDLEKNRMPWFANRGAFVKEAASLTMNDEEAKLFGPESNLYKKQLEFAEFVKHYTSQHVIHLIGQYAFENHMNITDVPQETIDRIVTNAFPECEQLFAIANAFSA